mmetsp:Transcript_66143/g.137849  ORF Transcript_66143/g.137849 Transcript_66143/m.137849 type:complete len:214 (-) Transcript_66143:582-1223(-)
MLAVGSSERCLPAREADGGGQSVEVVVRDELKFDDGDTELLEHDLKLLLVEGEPSQIAGEEEVALHTLYSRAVIFHRLDAPRVRESHFRQRVGGVGQRFVMLPEEEKEVREENSLRQPVAAFQVEHVHADRYVWRHNIFRVDLRTRILAPEDRPFPFSLRRNFNSKSDPCLIILLLFLLFFPLLLLSFFLFLLLLRQRCIERYICAISWLFRS